MPQHVPAPRIENHASRELMMVGRKLCVPRTSIKPFNFVDGNVARGCLSSLGVSAPECDSETCQICVGMDMPNGRNGCNNGVFPEHRLWCISCMGDENSDCAGHTNLTSTVCPIFSSDDQCYTARPDGNYERGCMSSPNKCKDGTPCRQCKGHNCNREDFNSAMTIFSDVKMIGLIAFSVVFTMLK
jgi:hypothetical protein